MDLTQNLTKFLICNLYVIITLVRKNMDVNKHERLSNFTLQIQIKVKEQHFHCCSTLHGHSRVLLVYVMVSPYMKFPCCRSSINLNNGL